MTGVYGWVSDWHYIYSLTYDYGVYGWVSDWHYIYSLTYDWSLWVSEWLTLHI